MKKIITLFLVFMCAVSLMFAFTPNAHCQSNNDLEVTSYTWYTSPYTGYLVVIGEVQNVGTDTIHNAVISGLAYNATGEVQAESVYPIIYTTQILPNGKAPFHMFFTDSSSINGTLDWVPTLDHIEFRINVIEANSTQYNNELYIVAHSSAVDSTGNYSVTGIVLNRGTGYPQNVWVVGTFYDAQGKVVAVGFSNYLSHYLPPNNYTQFSFTPIDPTPEMATTIQNYTLQVLSSGTTTEPTPTPSATSPTTTSPTISPGQSTSASTSPSGTDNSTSSSLLYVIVAGVAVVAIILVLVLVLRRRH